MAQYQMTVEKYDGDNYTDTVSVMTEERDHLAAQFELGELITSKRVTFENGAQTYYFYENGRIRVRKDLSQPRSRRR